MCGRYNPITVAEALVYLLVIDQVVFEDPEPAARYNITPGQSVPIVRNTAQANELLLAY